MAKATVSKGSQGPALRAVEPWALSAGRMHQLLTDDERARLAVVASIVRFKKGEVIYREGERVDAIFNIIGGVVTPYRTAPDGSEYIGAFLFAGDVFGLDLGPTVRYARTLQLAHVAERHRRAGRVLGIHRFKKGCFRCAAASRLFHNSQLNVDIAHVTINSIGRFMDRLARMKATIGYGASCNRSTHEIVDAIIEPIAPRRSAGFSFCQ